MTSTAIHRSASRRLRRTTTRSSPTSGASCTTASPHCQRRLRGARRVSASSGGTRGADLQRAAAAAMQVQRMLAASRVPHSTPTTRSSRRAIVTRAYVVRRIAPIAVSTSARSATARSSPASTSPSARSKRADYVVCTGLFDDERRDAGRLPRDCSRTARARPVHGVRQSRHRGRARRPADLLRRRARRRLRGRSAARSTTPASRTGRSTSARLTRLAARTARGATTPRSSACWRSAIRCAPICTARNRISAVDCLFVTAGIHAEELGSATTRISRRSARCSRQPGNAEGGDTETGVVIGFRHHA